MRATSLVEVGGKRTGAAGVVVLTLSRGAWEGTGTDRAGMATAGMGGGGGATEGAGGGRGLPDSAAKRREDLAGTPDVEGRG